MKESFGIDKVVGKGPEQIRQSLMRDLHEIFKTQVFEDAVINEILKYEAPKTNEEYQVIQLANTLVSKERLKYRSDAFEIPPKNIHIIEKEGFDKIKPTGADQKDFGGFFSPTHQALLIPEGKKPIELLKTLPHEMNHMKSHNAVKIEVINGVTGGGPYRSGLSAFLNETNKIHLFSLNEAVTESISRRLVKEGMKDPLFKKELAELEEKRKRYSSEVSEISKRYAIPVNEIFDFDLIQEGGNSYLQFNIPYTNESKIFADLVTKIAKKGAYDRNSVEAIFEKAYYTGNLHELVGTIDELFGQGSFRKIAQSDIMFEGSEKLGNVVASLR